MCDILFNCLLTLAVSITIECSMSDCNIDCTVCMKLAAAPLQYLCLIDETGTPAGTDTPR